ncbi:hypothetical protein IDJ81_14840 [Tsuneonella flava]|uniref:Uncharacterized protein n=1 Tax=Tsuneonella flava TaxID=2055955 RepID=A0ABX7KBK0_9SPHN|nr:hypothetical protein [Tsuneonella flava]QSB44546.1 hypothetical protein IDJ81_14840 [Tsuneonella flava]
MARKQLCIIATGVILGLTSGQAAARDDTNKDDSPHLEALRVCQNETAAEARLACFDKAVRTLLAADEQGDLRIVDREDVRKTRRSLFGFGLPDFGIFKSRSDKDKEDEQQFEQLETTITSVGGSRSRGYLLTTEEGAVWSLSQVPNRLMTPKAGQKVEIKKGALSSYFLRINGQPGVKGKRVQ